MKGHLRPGHSEKMGRMMSWMFYFGWAKSLVIMEMHYVIIIMQAMVVEMLWNDYGIVFCLCCCNFIWAPVVLSWWIMVHSLCLKSVCLETLWIYKGNTVEELYSRGGVYTGGAHTGGVYTREGHTGKGYSAACSLGGCGIETDIICGIVVKDMAHVYIKYVDEDMKRVYVEQVYDKILYGQDIKENYKENQMLRKVADKKLVIEKKLVEKMAHLQKAMV